MSERTIPVVDIGPFLAGADPAPTAELVEHVCSKVSFLRVVGHGIAPEVFAAAYRAMDAVLALPEADRAALASPDNHPFRGLSTMTGPAGEALCHRFQVCNYDDPAHAAAAGVAGDYESYFARNVWPERVTGLREDIQTCFAAMRKLGDALMELFARALGLAPDFFAPLLTHPVSDFAINSYPPQPERDSSEPMITFVEHSDSGMLTVLHQRGDYSGLQVQDLDGTWVSVPLDDDSLVINIGDLMSRWTNDHWPSTRHRVVAASDPVSTRASIATFHLPNVDAVISPMEPFLGEDGPHYDPVTTAAWEAMFLTKSYRRREAATG